MGKFKKGHLKVGGRKKGTPNKFTSLKDAFVNAFIRLGGENALYDWMTNQAMVERIFKDKKGHEKLVKLDFSGNRQETFFKLIATMLPKEVSLSGKVEGGDTHIHLTKVDIETKTPNELLDKILNRQNGNLVTTAGK